MERNDEFLIYKLAKFILIAALIVVVASICVYILFAIKNSWGWANEPSALATFGDYVSGTIGVVLAFATLLVLTFSIIIQKQGNTDAIRANTKAFVLSEYRAAITSVQRELENKKRSFSINQPYHKSSDKFIETTMTFWDFFHGGLRDWAPGCDPERVILVEGNWDDYFDTRDRMDESLRVELHYYAVKVVKLRFLIIRYLEEGGIADLFLEELEDARLSKQFLAGPVYAIRDEAFPSRISKSAIHVYEVSVQLIDKIDKVMD